MRADRLVAVLLFLQARGRVTAAELAGELEVSVRTARRDLEALAVAGVPVYSQAGRHGGWSLIGGARTDLSGLTAAEARALFLIAGPSSTVAPAAKTVLRKLVQALPETFRADARAAASAVVLDPVQWGGSPPPESSPHLETLEHAVIEGRQVVLGYVDSRRAATERAVHPLGLARKGASWYLVAGTDAGLRSFRVSRIRSVALTDEPVARPPGFDLALTWRSMVARIDERRRRVRATILAPAAAVPVLRGQFGDDLDVLEPAGDDGRATLAISASYPDRIAERLAGWGGFVEVAGPPEVREHLARIGTQLVERYGAGTEPPSTGETG